jgi:hypothetical protein
MATAPINPVNLFSAIRSCSKEHWWNTGKWLAYTVLCGFLPIIIGLLLVWIFATKPVNWYDFVVHGEFVIYSAALIAASSRLLTTCMSLRKREVHRRPATTSHVCSIREATVLSSNE